MRTVRDMQALLVEVTDAVEAAITAGNAVAQHQILSSVDFERMMDHLHRAAETLDRIAIQREAGQVIPWPAKGKHLS